VVAFTADNGGSLPHAQINAPWRGGKQDHYDGGLRGEWKLLQNDPCSPQELYHLTDDPGESTNLIGSAPPILRELRAALRRHIQRGGSTPWQKPNP